MKNEAVSSVGLRGIVLLAFFCGLGWLAACSPPSTYYLHVLADGPNPYCVLSPRDGPTADGQIGAIPGLVVPTPCPATVLAHGSAQGPIPIAARAVGQ